MATKPSASVSRYRAKASREDGWWLLTVDGLDLVTQARRLDRAEGTVRDLLAAWLDVAPSSIEVEIYVPELAGLIEDLRQRRAAASEAQAAAAQRAREIALLVSEKGLTVREIGVLLGISYQRAQQLIAS